MPSPWKRQANRCGGFDGTAFWTRGGVGFALSPAEMGGFMSQGIPAFGDSIGGMNIAGGISAPAADDGWVMTSYLAANAFVLPVTGWLSAHFGRRNCFLCSRAGQAGPRPGW